jgi:quercetin dioxygenase-like cupin family protein
MEDLDRRSAMALGLTVAAATPLVALGTPAMAEMYGPDQGKEYHPGVRVVMLGSRDSTISAYKKVQLSDTVFQPGSTWPDEAMPNDMVCTVIEGELEITQGDMKFTCKGGDVYSCGKGTHESATNKGSVAAVMRVVDLLPA